MSLGDALGPRQAVRHTYGQGESQVESGNPAQQEGYTRPSQRDDGWDGVSLGDAMRRSPHHDARQAPSAPQPAAATPSSNSGVQTKVQHDDPWAGISLGDAMGKKDAVASTPARAGAAAPIDWSKEPRRGGRRGGEVPASDGCDKSPSQILEWLKSLPESHVPEKAREELASIVEQGGMNGNAFTAYVQTVPPEVCAPKHAMKLKAAWKNVLAEAAHCAVSKQNLDAAANAPQKGVAVQC